MGCRGEQRIGARGSENKESPVENIGLRHPLAPGGKLVDGVASDYGA